MVINLHLGFGTTWITIGLVGCVISFLTGLARARAARRKRIGQLSTPRAPPRPETQAAIQQILVIARVDVGVLLLVVADMVLKPFS